VVVVARRTKTPHRISGCAHTVPRGYRVLGGARRPIARRPPLAVVAQPLQMSRRIVLPGRERQALSSWWTTALTYLLLLLLGYLLLTPVFTWGQRRLDDLRYGFPRATQLDGFVGHGEESGDPTHLIALNQRSRSASWSSPAAIRRRPWCWPALTWSAPMAPMSSRVWHWRMSTAMGQPICCSRFAMR